MRVQMTGQINSTSQQGRAVERDAVRPLEAQSRGRLTRS